MKSASRRGYIRLMAKANCLVKLASLTSKGTYRKTQSSLDASLPEGVPWSFRNWKANCVPGAMDSNLKNLWMHAF